MSKEPKQEGFGVIGLGRFGATLAAELAAAGQDVLVIDKSEAKIREARAYTDAAFVTDTLDKETLMEVGIPNCDTVIVCIGERIDTSILTTLTVKQLGVRRVIAKAISPDQGAVLEKLGAEVIYPESDMAVRLAKRLTTRSVLDFLRLSNDIELSELQMSRHCRFVGKTVAQSGMRSEYGVNIVAIVGKNGDISDVTPDRVLEPDGVIIVIGKKENIERLEQELCKE